MQIDGGTLQLVLTLLAPGGIAGLAVKLVLNGTKENVREIKSDVKDTRKAVDRLHERVDQVELTQADQRGYERAMRELERKG